MVELYNLVSQSKPKKTTQITMIKFYIEFYNVFNFIKNN